MAVLFRTRILTSVGAALGSAMCRDRELVMQAGLGPRLRSPLRLVLCWPAPPAHSGHRVLPEGRGHVSSTSLDLKECGEAQHRWRALPTRLEGNYVQPSHRVSVCPSIPLATFPHPALGPGRLVLSGPCQRGSPVLRLPDGSAQQELPGQEREDGIYPLSCLFAGRQGDSSALFYTRAASLAMVTRPPPAPQGRSGITASCCCWRSSWFAVPCCCPS